MFHRVSSFFTTIFNEKNNWWTNTNDLPPIISNFKTQMTYYQETIDKSKFRYEAMTYTRSSIKSRTTSLPVCTFSLQYKETKTNISMIELARWLVREKKEEDKTDLGSDKEAAENDLSFAATFKETENVNYSMFSFLAGRSEFAWK